MKIIADKAPKSRFPFTSECEHCHSIVEIEEQIDLKLILIEYSDPRDRTSWKDKVEGFHCPCCNMDSKLVKKKDINERVSLAEAQQNASIERVAKELDEISRNLELHG
jgi:hypothetical protein